MIPNKKRLNVNHIFPVTAILDLDDYIWVWKQAQKLNVSKSEILRRCIKDSKKRTIFGSIDDSRYLPCVCGHNRRRSTIDGDGNVTVTCYKCKYTMKFSLDGRWSDTKVRKIWNNEMRRLNDAH